MIIRQPPPILLRILHHALLIHPLPRRLQRRILDPRLQLHLELLTYATIHFRRYGAWVQRIDRGALRQLPAPGPGHGFEGGFGAAVDGLPGEAEAGGDGGDVDDAAGAVVGEVRQSGLHEQDGPEDVDGVRFVEIFGGDVGNVVVGCDGSVVDDDIDLERAGLGVREVVLGGFDDVGGTGGRTHVGLDREGTDIVFVLEGGGDFRRGFRGGVGAVVED